MSQSVEKLAAMLARVERIIEANDTWEWKYDTVFALYTKKRDEIPDLKYLDYFSYDTSYEEDVMAFVWGLRRLYTRVSERGYDDDDEE